MVNRDERGQMLLIGGVLLAVAIVALGIVFNGAVYTSILASEGGDEMGGQEAIGLQQDVERMVGEAIERGIRKENQGGPDAEDYVEKRVPSIREQLRSYESGDGKLFNITYITDLSGNYVYNNSKDFTNNSDGGSDWTPFKNGYIRNFSLTISNAASGSGPLAITIVGDKSNRYQLRVISDEKVEGYRVGLSKERLGSCSNSSGPLKIGISNATVNGDYCEAIDFFENMEPPYTVNIDNGSSYEGSYRFVSYDGNINSAAKSEGRLFGVEISYNYFTPRIDYETTLRVAPGELSS